MSQTLLSILAFVPLVLAGVLLIGFRWPAKYAMPLVFVLTALIGLLAWDMTLNRVIASTFQGLILTAAAILLFLLNLRRAGERAERAAERLEARERNDAIHRQMLDAAARRPANRDALADRLRDGRF